MEEYKKYTATIDLSYVNRERVNLSTSQWNSLNHFIIELRDDVHSFCRKYKIKSDVRRMIFGSYYFRQADYHESQGKLRKARKLYKKAKKCGDQRAQACLKRLK